jgi:uncharacterized surface protein with fasciclin (FAS1) repeats
MKKIFQTLTIAAIAAMITSCAEKKTETITDHGEKKGDEAKLVDSPASSGKEYAEDAIAYAMNSKDLGTWTYCLNASKWFADVKTGEFTFLGVTDGSLELNERVHLRELTRVENKNLLDEVVGRHILKGQFRPEDLLQQKEVETISGEKLKVNTEAGTIDGIIVSSRYVASPAMYIVVIDDIMRYPSLELKESISKHSKK